MDFSFDSEFLSWIELESLSWIWIRIFFLPSFLDLGLEKETRKGLSLISIRICIRKVTKIRIYSYFYSKRVKSRISIRTNYLKKGLALEQYRNYLRTIQKLALQTLEQYRN